MKSLLGLFGLTALACVLRGYGLGDNSLWLDEFTSIDIASKSLSDIVLGRGFNSHTPPFYYVVLHFWLKLFGANEIGLRSLSLVCDLINVVLVYRVSRLLFDDLRVALAASTLYAIAPYAIFYAQEGRMYTLLVSLCLLTAEMVLRFPFKSWLPSVGFVLLASLGMYTHYYYALFLAGLSVFAILQGTWSQRNRVHYILLGCCIAIMFIPWLQVIRRIVSGEGQDFREYVWSVLPYTFFRYSAGYGVMVLNIEAKSDIQKTLFEHYLPLALYFSVFGLASLLGVYLLAKTNVRACRFIVFLVLGPALLALCISQITPMLSERYLIVSYPFFILNIASLVVSRKLQPLLLACVLGIVFGLYQHMYNPMLANTEWRGAANEIRNSQYKCAHVYVNPQYSRGIAEFYLPDHRVYSSKNEIDFRSSQACLWLLERGTAEPAIQSFLRHNYVESYKQYFPYENGLTLRYLEKTIL